MKWIILLFVTLPIFGAEFYKCKDKNGQMVFSQFPCSPDAQKQELKEVQAVDGGMTGEKSSTINLDADRSHALRMTKMRIAKKQNELGALRDKMNARIAQLQNDKKRSANNMAGATWESSLSEEMNAVTNQYTAQMNLVQAEISSLQADYDRIVNMK